MIPRYRQDKPDDPIFGAGLFSLIIFPMIPRCRQDKPEDPTFGAGLFTLFILPMIPRYRQDKPEDPIFGAGLFTLFIRSLVSFVLNLRLLWALMKNTDTFSDFIVELKEAPVRPTLPSSLVLLGKLH